MNLLGVGWGRWSVLTALWLISCGADRSPAAANHVAAPTPSTDANSPPDAGETTDAFADLDASTDADTEVVDAGLQRPRLGSVSHYTWVYKNPSRGQQPIGYVRPGTSVLLTETEPVRGSGCQGGKYFRVEPTGYVCSDSSMTVDLDAPLFRALAEAVAPRDDVLPYRYAYSTGAPMYGRVPEEAEAPRAERGFVRISELPSSGKPRTSYEELAEYEVLRGVDPIPSFAAHGAELPRMRGYAPGLVRKSIPAGSLLSFSRAFEVQGRTYLLSPDLTLVPSDRVRPFRETLFNGRVIDAQVQLPIAWTKGAPRKKYRRLDDGTFEATQDTWPPRTLLELTGVEQTHKTWVYLETREAGLYIRARDASVVTAKTRLPPTVKDGDKWIEFSASKGTFTLFVGKDPVYSTLASPGRGGGAPSSKMSVEALVEGSYTPLGVYRVTFKTKATTMTPEGSPNPKDHWIQDVPYTQYFRRPFAIHAAYWHEDFGMPKSGGCINLSPKDAQFVFDWTDPPMPRDWSGVSSSEQMGLGTPVVIRR